MRLLNIKTLELESFFDKDVPRYAILSHRWGPEELTYEDMRAGPSRAARRKKGFAKVRDFCDRVRDPAPGLKCEYVWVDTCCIDKSSSAELSEAINSMFKWYERAVTCFAFLDDVTADGKKPMSKSLWFTRGWTLQELIAPSQVVLCDSDWKSLGDRVSLSRELAKVTGIPASFLSRDPQPQVTKIWLDSYSVAAKRSWASPRVTTRVEDEAYCLMGLFGIHMPLIYGEGSKAFRRLQEAIISETHDPSILIHETLGPGPLAPSARYFRYSSNIRHGLEVDGINRLGVALVNQEVELTALTCPARVSCCPDSNSAVWSLALLDCAFDGDHLSRPALLLSHAGTDANVNRVYRYHCRRPFCVSAGDGIGERVYEEDTFKVSYDLSKCKIKRLYIGEIKPLNYMAMSSMYQAPLRVTHTGQITYRTKYIVVNPDTVRLLSSLDKILWMTDDKSDEFFIFWHLVQSDGNTGRYVPPTAWFPGWWRDCVPWCSIIERYGALGQVSPPEEGEEKAWFEDVLTKAKNVFTSELLEDSLTSRRPTGSEIHIATTAVDFLGRRDFELKIEERMPPPTPEGEVS